MRLLTLLSNKDPRVGALASDGVLPAIHIHRLVAFLQEFFRVHDLLRKGGDRFGHS